MAAPATTIEVRTAPLGVPSLAALDGLLDELVCLLADTPEAVYAAKPLPAVSGSIGGHVRHTLDHVAAFVGVNPSTTLCYDHRDRGTAVESHPSAAVSAILRLKDALSDPALADLEQPVRVQSQVSAAGESVTGWSTLGRELAFVVSHTVHHQAIIATLLAVQGRHVPPWFGYSPSTPRTAG